jgi:simple sugar transport system ATP-binding protein
MPSVGTIERSGSVALIPEDRQRDAIIQSFSLTENVVLKGSGAARGRTRWRNWRARTQRLVREYDVRAASVDISVRTLSGGNQQKLVLARELSDNPHLVVAENPTRGLDIRAAAEVHHRLREAASNGAGVVVYSSDLDEVLALATRIVAVHAGEVWEVPNEREAAGRAMLGLK